MLMRIGLVASIWIRVPPKGFGFGAQEYLAYELAEGLTKRGHDVTLFASGDSQTSAKLVSISPTQVINIPSSDPMIKDYFEMMNLEEAYKYAERFDIIHNHLLPYGLLFSNLVKTPTIHTLHHKLYSNRADLYLYKHFNQQNFISISNAQRHNLPDLHYVDTVYNGIDATFYHYKENPDGNYLLYIGRMRPYKGIHSAIQAAHRLNLPLKIAAPLPHRSQHDYGEIMQYWNTQIKPNLGGTIEHLDEVGGKDKIRLIQDAKALLFPVEREEPFGMTVIEAMSCGTPVVAYDLGAMSELIEDGKTGYLINFDEQNQQKREISLPGIEGLIKAVKTIYEMPEKPYQTMRLHARKHVEAHFTVEKMVEGYEKVYQKILRG